MGGQGSGRKKKGSTDTSKAGNGSKKSDKVERKRLSKSQPDYGGPPKYLLDPNRKDPFADPRYVVQDKDGTNHPTNYGRNMHSSIQSISANGVVSENMTYGHENRPVGNPSELEATLVAANALTALRGDLPAQQVDMLSAPRSSSGKNRPYKTSRPPTSQNIPSKQDKKRPATAIDRNFSPDLEETPVLARRNRTIGSGFLAEANDFERATHNIVQTQQDRIVRQPQTNSPSATNIFGAPAPDIRPPLSRTGFLGRQQEPTNARTASRQRQVVPSRQVYHIRDYFL
jgi:hypothetical protein